VIRVKICGITSVDDALACVDAGADALGFVFVENTPRFVTPAQAAAIVRRLPPFVTPVGVFWDHPAGHVKAVAEACGLRALQFHGAEPPEDLAGHERTVIKTIKLPPAEAAAGAAALDIERLRRYPPAVAAFLLDSTARWSEGEARAPVAWEAARTLGEHFTIVLSAGLTPDNVARAVAIARPYAVDVNSGVEAAPGRKDLDKVRRFVAQARRTA
jgi:phosphoribosylanthranilate isomerase